jgi:hypothetical protein
MRDLINIILTESVGLANRKPGDLWQNDQGDQVVFQSLTFYPDAGSYETLEELQQALELAGKERGITVDNMVWSNQSRGAGAFAIAHFKDANNESRDYYVNRWFRSISPNRTENNFPNDLPGGFRLQTKSAKKERSGYKPSDVLTKFDDLTPNDILSQIQAKFGADSDESRATQIFMAADSFPVTMPLGSMNFEAFTNYFCEMLQPIALVMGKPTQGNAAQAEDKFLTQGGYTTCTIKFDTSKTGGLVDSKLVNPAGQSMGLSSKAKSGAKASARNLKEKVDEMRGTEDGSKLIDRYKTEVAILDMIVDGGYDHGPLNLALSFGMIAPEERQQVLSLRKMGLKDFRLDKMSKSLQKYWKARSAADPESIGPFYHMLAAIAYPVADYINKNTNFSRAASDILNYGAFMQAYTFASKKGENIVLKEFQVKYPSTAVTDVLLSAHKTYYSTNNKGNFTFQILKNGATVAEVDAAETDASPEQSPVAAPNVVTGKRVDIKPKSTTRTKRDQNIGRERR